MGQDIIQTFILLVPINFMISTTNTLKNIWDSWAGVGEHFIYLMADF
jgi:hypothetical protein